MDRWVTPPERVTSPTWGPPHPCKEALIQGDMSDFSPEESLTPLSERSREQKTNKRA